MDESAQRLVTLEADCNQLFEDAATRVTYKPRVAAWGLVRAGKSSLLNMLAGRVGKEYFKSGVVRTTRSNTELEHDVFILEDTPGLGIKFEDSQQAFEDLEQADIVLFVHAPADELDAEEIELLQHAKAALGEHAERRLVVVLTRLDKYPHGSLDSIARRVGDQLRDTVGIVPACFQVSSLCYKQGWAEDNTALVEKSGIPDLIEHLERLVAEITDRLEAEQHQRRQVHKAALIEALDQAIAAEGETVSVLQRPYTDKAREFNRLMAQLKETFASQSAHINILKNRLENS